MGSPIPAKADEKFMRRAVILARRALGDTHPNPAVGAVLVRAGRVIGEGWHHGAGLPHAEIEALRAAGSAVVGATLYVTLEPCSTHGRTPPCTQAIIESGIKRVVYGATDPNPRHAGRAKKLLEKSGVSVTTGILADTCADLNRHWNKWIATGLPYVVAKAALTLDGRISSHPESRWISNELSRRDTMKLRAGFQAILVGGATVRADDPQLTVRGVRVPSQPWRAVWTKSGRLPRNARILTDSEKGRTIVLREASLKSALKTLGSRGIASVLLEGGGHVLGAAFDHDLVDEVCFYLAPQLAGGLTPAVAGLGAGSNESAVRLTDVLYKRFGGDVRLTGRVLKS